jgi:multidrug efflux system membrane fusion protein
VNVHLVLENRPNALVIPSAAIQTGLNGSLFVWTVNDDGKGGQAAQMQPVKVALAEGQVTILDSGPAPGAKVVVDGADRLRPGQPVTVAASRQGRNQASDDGSQPAGQSDQNNPFAGANSGKQAKTGQTQQNPGADQRRHQ